MTDTAIDTRPTLYFSHPISAAGGDYLQLMKELKQWMDHPGFPLRRLKHYTEERTFNPETDEGALWDTDITKGAASADFVIADVGHSSAGAAIETAAAASTCDAMLLLTSETKPYTCSPVIYSLARHYKQKVTLKQYLELNFSHISQMITRWVNVQSI